MAKRNGGKGGGKKKGSIDPFIGSRLVEGLEAGNFTGFLTEKDAALVMFYDPNEPQCEWSKKHFLKAAKTTKRDNHAYAAVDCTKEGELCAQEGVQNLPTFKLYTRAKTVDTYRNALSFTYQTMVKFVENAPDLGPEPVPCYGNQKRPA